MSEGRLSEGLAVEGLTSGYGSSAVVNSVSCRLAPGEALALVGKNGMGKTSLLKAVLGFLPAWKGSVRLDGRDITAMPPHLKRRLGLIHVPQEKALFQDLTIHENLRLGVLRDRDLEARLEEVAGWFPVLGRRLRQRAGTLSGGEQKMLIVARALIGGPRVLMLDEVSEGLQPAMVDRLSEVLIDARARRGIAMLVVEQHIPFVLGIADRFAVFKRGEVIETGAVGAGSAEQIETHMKL